jgi:predicted CXXCH cytochrome family protein
MVSRFTRSLALIVFALCLAGFAPASQPNQDKSAGGAQAKAASARAAVRMEKVTATRPSDPNLYAGTETCVTCHEDIGQSHNKGPHAKTEAGKNGPGFKGCEGCHGPGRDHAESGGDTGKIVNLKNLSRAESTRTCLECHETGEEHANFLRSKHAVNRVGCIDCHSPHKARGPAHLLKTGEPQICNGCHKNVKSDPSKPLHHAVNENLTGCTNCHNAHGNKAPAQTSLVCGDAGGSITGCGSSRGQFSIPKTLEES